MKSLLNYGFGLKDVKYLKTEYIANGIRLYVKTKQSKLCCSACQSKLVTKKGFKEREFRTVPIGLKPVYIIACVQRLKCMECGLIRQESMSWADKKNLYPSTRTDGYRSFGFRNDKRRIKVYGPRMAYSKRNRKKMVETPLFKTPIKRCKVHSN